MSPSISPATATTGGENEPGQLSGWAHRVKQGEDFVSPFVRRCADVLDYMIEAGYTDPQRVAACGTSRGGFCALRLAAAEPRIRAVTCVSPVTNLLALREFDGVTAEQAAPHNVLTFADKLAGRAVWLSIGNDDGRVNTGDCITVARSLVAQSRRRHPKQKTVPVELIVSVPAKAIGQLMTPTRWQLVSLRNTSRDRLNRLGSRRV